MRGNFLPEPRWLDEREAGMWRAYLDMHRQLLSKLDRELQKDGLSAADYALLVPLSEAPKRELRARDLGKAVGWDRSRLSHQIRRMEDRGIIERRECGSDARGTWISITDAGITAIKGAAPRHVEAVREHFVGLLSSEEVDEISEIARRVLEKLGDQSGEVCRSVMDPACAEDNS